MNDSPSNVEPLSPLPVDYATKGDRLRVAATRKGQQEARRLAMHLTIIGVIITVVCAGLIGTFLGPGGTNESRRDVLMCANNLRQIGLACLMYANDHGGIYPDTLGVVLREEDITSKVFVCPYTKDTPAHGPTTAATVMNLTAGGHLSYIYVGKGLTNSAGADVVVAYEPLANHGDGMNVLYADSRVDYVDATTAKWIAAEVQVGHNPPRMLGATLPVSRPVSMP